MKTKVFFIQMAILSMLVCVVSSCGNFNNTNQHLSQSLTPQHDANIGKYGFVNEKGKKIIPFIYDNALPFRLVDSQWVAQVGINGKFGYIDTKGKEIIPIIYDEIGNFQDGLAKVKLREKYGYVNMARKEIIFAIYDSVGAFENDLVKVELNGKCGYLSNTREEIIPVKYDKIEQFVYQNGAIAKAASNGKYGYINKQGKEIIPVIYDYVDVFKNDLIKVELDGKYGYVSDTGKEIIPLEYDDIGNFSDGLTWVKLNGKYGYIDKEGKMVIPFKYDEADNFSQNSARVKLGGDVGTIDTDGKFTLRSKALTLLDAVKAKYVRFSAQGGSIQSSYINIENLTDMTLNLIIPAGTYLNAKSSGYQNMVLTNPYDIELNAKETYSSSVNTACMNMYRSIPHDGNSFGIAQHLDSHLLTKVIKVLNEEGIKKYSVIQAAVWIVTDNANYDSMGTLHSNYGRVIDDEAYNEALSIVNKARKMD